MRIGVLGRILAAAGLTGACAKSASTAPTPTGTIELRASGTPANDFQSVTLFITGVSLQHPGSPEVVVNNTRISFELMSLADGATKVVLSADVATGRYSLLKVTIDSAVVTLTAGRTFAGGSATTRLLPTTGAQVLDLGGDVTLEEGATVVLLLDVDLSRSILLQGPPAAPTGATFSPAVLALQLDRAGSISGTVSPAGSKAAVYAIRGADTVQTAFANAGTGAFTLRYLPPGTYIAAARAAGFQVALSLPLLVEEAATVSGINLTLNTLP